MESLTKTRLTGAAMLVAALASITAVWWLTSSYLDKSYADAHYGCFPTYINHTVTIQNDKVIPENTVGTKCDTMTITNRDDAQRLIAFGPHEHHVAYDGVLERVLIKNQSLTVTLVQTGNFGFHDHIHDDVKGTFTVNTKK